jgi:hypothetical protein
MQDTKEIQTIVNISDNGDFMKLPSWKMRELKSTYLTFFALDAIFNVGTVVLTGWNFIMGTSGGLMLPLPGNIYSRFYYSTIILIAIYILFFIEVLLEKRPANST